MATIPNYIRPPKTLDIQMYYYISGDPDLPPSLAPVLASLAPNEYLINGFLNSILFTTALIYNPGTGREEQYYDAYNVVPGDWLASDATGYTWRIKSIYNVTDGPTVYNTSQQVFFAVMEDVDYYNAGMDPTGTGFGAPTFIDSRTILFELDEDGFPIFTPADTFQIATNFSGNVIGRFRALNIYNKYVSIYQPDVSGNFAVGDPLYIDPADGLFKSSAGLGDISGVYTTIGICTSVGEPDEDHFTFNPFGEYRSYTETGLTGDPGTLYYINPSGVPPYTTTRSPLFPYPAYQLIDPSGNAILLKDIGFASSGSGSGGGGTGPTGPAGPVTSYIFDGGNAASTYVLGPAFDCGSST